MSFIDKKAQKNKCQQLFVFFLLQHFFLTYYVQVLCNVRLVEHQNKNYFSWNHLTFIDITFKSQDGIKGKNSISQQAMLLSEHSRVCGKYKAWDNKNQRTKIRDFPLHWKRDTQVALQVFEAWSLSLTLLTRSVAPYDMWRLKLHPYMCKNFRKSHACWACTHRAQFFSCKRVHVGLYTFKFKPKDTNIQPCISKYIPGLLGQ